MKESKKICYKILAKNRYASCPQDISKRQFAAVKSYMTKKFMKELLATPSGLYTDSELWSQTFRSLM